MRCLLSSHTVVKWVFWAGRQGWVSFSCVPRSPSRPTYVPGLLPRTVAVLSLAWLDLGCPITTSGLWPFEKGESEGHTEDLSAMSSPKCHGGILHTWFYLIRDWIMPYRGDRNMKYIAWSQEGRESEFWWSGSWTWKAVLCSCFLILLSHALADCLCDVVFF